MPYKSEATARPVFIVGCPRSGTTLLSHMLSASGHFATYRAETHFFDQILPRFGPLDRAKNRERLLELWLKSEYARRTGISLEKLSEALGNARSGGEFLRSLMEAICLDQGVSRWSECTPAHGLHLRRIKDELPDALIVHAVRDARDVALSLNRLGWVNPLPWDQEHRLHVAGWTWEWIVNRIRAEGETLGDDYVEVRFEELVLRPSQALQRLGEFVGERLDLETIMANPIGSLKQANSAFGDLATGLDPSAASRWRRTFPPEELGLFEQLVGDTMISFGYKLHPVQSRSPLSWALRRRSFHAYRTTRHLIKAIPPVARALTHTELESSGGP